MVSTLDNLIVTWLKISLLQSVAIQPMNKLSHSQKQTTQVPWFDDYRVEVVPNLKVNSFKYILLMAQLFALTSRTNPPWMSSNLPSLWPQTWSNMRPDYIEISRLTAENVRVRMRG